MSEERRRHLYRGKEGEESRREIERRYEREGETPVEARESYGKIVGSVKREQVEKGTSPNREWIRQHEARNPEGGEHRVRGHYSHVHAHGDRHHGPPCNGNCKRGMEAHEHRRGRGH